MNENVEHKEARLITQASMAQIKLELNFSDPALVDEENGGIRNLSNGSNHQLSAEMKDGGENI